jgi:antitoxin component YwqK of YwqJK toxin-antitoxin module
MRLSISNHIQRLILINIFLHGLVLPALSQYKEYKISVKKDTINAIDKNNLKQGKWVISVPELRGEPGYEEEGIFIDGKKEGVWRRYSMTSDLLAIENYRFGGKDGTQQYFSKLGDLAREENWRAYNPDAPYDTIPVYGTGSNEIISYKVVKAEQYSVRNGEWKYYDPSTGRITKTETYDRGRLQTPADNTAMTDEKPKAKVKPKEVLEFEKKHSGRRKVKLREGQTGL